MRLAICFSSKTAPASLQACHDKNDKNEETKIPACVPIKVPVRLHKKHCLDILSSFHLIYPDLE